MCAEQSLPHSLPGSGLGYNSGMAALQLEVSPHSFNVYPEGPEDGQFVARDVLPGGLPSRLESAFPPELARRVVEGHAFAEPPRA